MMREEFTRAIIAALGHSRIKYRHKDRSHKQGSFYRNG
jgi:hypothetical protein